MESWRQVWRQGAVPLLSTPALEALRTALLQDAQTLVQGATTEPPPLNCMVDQLVEAACALGFCAVVDEGGFGAATVGECERRFAEWVFEIDQRMGYPQASRDFINWFDETPRPEMRPALLAEVNKTLAERYCAVGEIPEPDCVAG